MKKIDIYYWLGYLGIHEVKGFVYDEDTEVLTLYTYTDDEKDIRTIVDLSYADSPTQLETFTDEEINEHLLETYEEYIHGDDLSIHLKEANMKQIKNGNESFGINVTVKFAQVVDAESYEEAVEIVKSNFLEDYKIKLEDHEIDPVEFDLRSVLDLLDANGYEDASNFLQLHFAEEGGE